VLFRSIADRFGFFCQRNHIDCIKITPSHFQAMLAAREEPYMVPSQRVVFGGEVLSRELVSVVRSLRRGCRVYNHYGPTECTVGMLTGDVTGWCDMSGGRG